MCVGVGLWPVRCVLFCIGVGVWVVFGGAEGVTKQVMDRQRLLWWCSATLNK